LPFLRILALVAGRISRRGGRALLQGMIDRRSRDIERLGDFQDRAAGFFELLDLVDGDLALAALVNAGGLGLSDAFELALFTQVSLEFGKHAEYVEKTLPHRIRSIDRLLCGAQAYTFRLELTDDVLKVADGAGQTVDPSDDKLVALAHELQQQLKFGAPGAAGAGSFFHPNYPAPGCFKGRLLD